MCCETVPHSSFVLSRLVFTFRHGSFSPARRRIIRPIQQALGKGSRRHESDRKRPPVLLVSFLPHPSPSSFWISLLEIRWTSKRCPFSAMARRPPDPSPLGGLGTALFSLWLLVNLTTLPANAQQQPNQQQQNQKHHQNTPQLNRAASFSSRSDTRALIPFAPDERLNRDAVRAPAHPARRATGGLSSRIHPTRSLQDWKVEDVVLLATVDGMIHASDRNTGTELWYLEADNPMVETVYHARNRSVDGRGRLQIR